MTDDEQQLAVLFNTQPGYSEPGFWRGVKAAAGLARIRSTMSFAVREAAKDNFEPLAGLALDAFGQDARHEALVDALAEHLGGTLQARASARWPECPSPSRRTSTWRGGRPRTACGSSGIT
ncbi:hypothetical protein SNOUR_38725 [Streptomyces noursei ATCC 11455]|uniref:hypothetical protein n=1 Tax=Streptomyces noursei TaxID=1971 RepID=UPI00081C3763|nr:hypothetical protein SNOUR_38725 [Streptomyces noursei ATCC 11455]